MGCFNSKSRDERGTKKKPGQAGEVAVFVPGLRIPKSIDFGRSLQGYLSPGMIERLSALRTRIVVMAAGEGSAATKPKRKTATQHGGSTVADLQQALEDYLPVLLGLTREGSRLKDLVEFVWVNQEDDKQETAIPNAWYEVLSVLHMMGMLSLSQANYLLIPKAPVDGYQPKVTEENKKAAIDIFLKAAGYLDCAVRRIFPQIPEDIKSMLPADLKEGVLQALAVQALGQGVDIQLGLAIDNAKATLAVKRRLACEEVKYWNQAQDSTSDLPLGSEWGEKHRLFIKWKHAEAKAAAYYYHGLILDEGNGENTHANAVASLQAADQFLKESKKACTEFCHAAPTTSVPPLWGAMKYLSEKIPKDASSKARINRDVYSREKVPETPPKLPDFSVALKPSEYELPPIDQGWKEEVEMQPYTVPSLEENKRDGKVENLQTDQIKIERRPSVV
uniref:BRO1 domain-containing protein n=1 Tax=Araucaria cunninghamii TaxID=56994 RepID=A0A0D6QU61_ARACU